MKTLDEIKAPVAAEMEAFEHHFRESMRSRVALLDKITHYIVKRKGKQIRPMFVFLCAKACGTFTEAAHHGAALVELLHTATLVHDDVVDDAWQRRGFFSINALWKNKIAVLVGDYLLSRGLLLSLDHKQYRLLHLVSDAVRKMSEGELLQIEKARRLDITEEVYYEIIRNKTASLIASCCAVGAAASGADEDRIETMRAFGEKVGIAFQIKDDLLDFGDSETGKAKGGDIKERKLTLPLIHALQQAPAGERRKMKSLIRSGSDKPEVVEEVIHYIQKSGGIAYARKAMELHVNEAIALLDTLPESESRESLRALVHFTINRTS